MKFSDYFGEDNTPKEEIFPLPQPVGVGIPVQAVTADMEIPPLTMHLCDVCKDAEMHGVFGSSCGPISFAYCYECASKGAEPYGALVAYISSAYGVQEWDNPSTQMHYRDSQLVKATLEVAGKTFSEWVDDVRKSIVSFDAEYDEHLRKEGIIGQVQEHPEKEFSFSELAGVFSKPDDAARIEVVTEKYDNSMSLLVDYMGKYHLFHALGDDKFSYSHPVFFAEPSDPRLKG